MRGLGMGMGGVRRGEGSSSVCAVHDRIWGGKGKGENRGSGAIWGGHL